MPKPRIRVDYAKCTAPEECRKCLQVCPPVVFNLTFVDEDYHDPKQWRVVPVFPQLCLQASCNACVRQCPQGAIQIKS